MKNARNLTLRISMTSKQSMNIQVKKKSKTLTAFNDLSISLEFDTERINVVLICCYVA